MASLKNASNDTYININLQNIDESPKWIGYDLIVFIKENEFLSELLSMYNTGGLYFENEFTPEVPDIYNSLNLLVNGDISQYLFEPIDEKDFCLEINRIKDTSGDYFKVQLFMDKPKIRSRPGIQMYSTAKDLTNFSNELRKEYEELMSEFKQK